MTGAEKFSQKDMAAITLARQYARQIDAVVTDPESSLVTASRQCIWLRTRWPRCERWG